MTIRMLMLSVVVILAGCSKSVYTDYDQSFPYQDIRTYQIAAKPSTSPISLDDNRIQRALNNEMLALGLTESASAPNVELRYYIEPKSEAIAYGPTFSFGYGSRRFGAVYETPVRVEQRDYGQLVVEMIDNASNQVIWKAVSNRKLTDSMSPSSKNAFINEQVKAMFDSFPPNKLNNQT